MPGRSFAVAGYPAQAGAVDSASPNELLAAEDPLARRVVAEVLGGDRDAFRALIERESAFVLRICYRVLGNAADAEDAAQESFVTAYRALGTWRGEGPFSAWLARIAVRVAMRHAGRRSAFRRLTWIEPPAEGSGGDGRMGARVAATEAEDPAGTVLRSERAARVRRALAHLDEPYREVVALRFFGDLSLAEIATESGRPLGTVKTQLHRGLQRMRAALEDER